MQTCIYKINEQGPTVEHRELYSVPCNKPYWKRTYILIHMSESLCCVAEINITLQVKCTSVKFFKINIVNSNNTANLFMNPSHFLQGKAYSLNFFLILGK